MRFHERLYKLHLILGHPDAPPLWLPNQWRSIQNELHQATKAARGPASLNLLQYEPNGQYFKNVKFGRLGVSVKSEARWLHDYATYPERQSWLFHSLDLWAPGRTTCCNQDMAPDIYLGIMNEGYYTPNMQLTFNPCVVLAGATDKGPEFLSIIDELAGTIARQTQAVFTHSKTTPWGAASGAGFTKAIGDLLTSFVFKAGLRHSSLPFLDRLDEYWQ